MCTCASSYLQKIILLIFSDECVYYRRRLSASRFATPRALKLIYSHWIPCMRVYVLTINIEMLTAAVISSPNYYAIYYLR